MSFNELAGAPKSPIKFIPKYRQERWDKNPHIGYQTEEGNKKTIDQVRGPLNELIENLKIEKQENPPVEDSDLPDALIFAMKETTGYRCMKEAENKLLVDNFIQHQYFQEFILTLPYYYICDSRIVKNLEEIAKENNFTFYIPADDPKPKCENTKGGKKIVDKKEKCVVQFFCLNTLDKSEIKKLKDKISKVNLSTYYSAKDTIVGAPEQTQRQEYLPLFTEIWINSNNETVDSFLRNIAKAEGGNSNPYNFYFEEPREQKEQTTKSDLSTEYIEARKKIDTFVKDSQKESFTLDDFWEQTTETYDPNFAYSMGKEREDFKALMNLSKCPSLLGLSWFLLHKLVFKLSAKRKEFLYKKFGIGSSLINLQIYAAKWYTDKTDYYLAIQFSKIMLKSLFSDALRIRYQFEMENFIFRNIGGGIARTDSEEIKQPRRNFIDILEKNDVKKPTQLHELEFSPETLVKRCEIYKTVAFVRGTAQPTDDVAVLREWGSNATVASGGDKTFYLLQVFSLVKWLTTQAEKIEHIVGHSRGAGIAYNAAMIYNYIFKFDQGVKQIKFCGLDGAVTLPVPIRVPSITSSTTADFDITETIKPDSIFSRNINMASVLDGALLDPLGEQERVYPNCKPTADGDESENIKSILSDVLPFDFSDAATLQAIYFSFTEQKNQGIGHDAGTAGTGYRLELEKKIQEKIDKKNSTLSWMNVATGFKRNSNAFKKGEWPKAKRTNDYSKKENDGERYKDLIFFSFEAQRNQKNPMWVFMNQNGDYEDETK